MLYVQMGKPRFAGFSVLTNLYVVVLFSKIFFVDAGRTRYAHWPLLKLEVRLNHEGCTVLSFRRLYMNGILKAQSNFLLNL